MTDLAGVMSKKSGMKPEKFIAGVEQGRLWVEYAFYDGPLQRKPVPQPKFFYGNLGPHQLSPDQLEQNFGKGHRSNMTLQMMPDRVSVRFIGFKAKPPCGQTLIRFSKAYAKDGVLIIHEPKFHPSRRGQ